MVSTIYIPFYIINAKIRLHIYYNFTAQPFNPFYLNLTREDTLIPEEIHVYCGTFQYPPVL